MKTKILTTATIICLGIAFQGCEKEDTSTPDAFSVDNKSKSFEKNTKTAIYGDPIYNEEIYDAALITENHFKNQGIVPEADDWYNYFENNYSNNLTAPLSTDNELEATDALNNYLTAIFSISNAESNSISLDSLMEAELLLVATNPNLSATEKDHISNAIYILNAMVDVSHNFATIQVSERPHPFEVAFNACMRERVPGGFVGNLYWVFSFKMFRDVVDCTEHALKVINFE